MAERWHYDKSAGLVVPVDEAGAYAGPPPYICRGIAPGKGPLIAAAPDLLAALVELVELKDDVKELDQAEYFRRKPLAWQAARDAIAKAIGEGA